MPKALAAALLVLALALVGCDVRDNENNKFHSEFKSSPSEISYWKKGMGWMKCVMLCYVQLFIQPNADGKEYFL